jgi:uncharacterized membrane protein
MRILLSCTAAAIVIAAAACQPADDRAGVSSGAASEAKSQPAPPAPTVVDSGRTAPFAAIAADETIRFTGTEPFWGGTIRAGEMLYSTPENQEGQAIAVSRFAGNNGLGFSGSLDGRAVDLTVTPGSCSDGMSDRTYPFTVTLRLGEEQRSGCAWTDRTPFTGPANP